MFEYHGWLTVRDKYENIETEDEDVVFAKIVNDIKNHIIDLNWGHGVLDIRFINAACHIWTSGFHNHKPIGKYCPITFFRYVAEIAPGSYGLLYIRDSDDMVDENYNKFTAYVVARGQVIEHTDPFLSPFVPTAEGFPMD